MENPGSGQWKFIMDADHVMADRDSGRAGMKGQLSINSTVPLPTPHIVIFFLQVGPCSPEIAQLAGEASIQVNLWTKPPDFLHAQPCDFIILLNPYTNFFYIATTNMVPIFR